MDRHRVCLAEVAPQDLECVPLLSTVSPSSDTLAALASRVLSMSHSASQRGRSDAGDVLFGLAGVIFCVWKVLKGK